MSCCDLFYRCYHCFFNDTSTTQIYTLSLHDALPISDLKTASRLIGDVCCESGGRYGDVVKKCLFWHGSEDANQAFRSEEHTSELQSLTNLVCRLLLEKKKQKRLHSRLKPSMRTTTND